MAFRTFVAGETLTAANVNDFLMKQAVIVCTSGTRPGSPVEGMTIFETDTDKLLTYDGTNWLLPDNVAAGNLGYAQVTADQTGITAETDLTGLSVTVTVGAGRRIRVWVQGQVDSTVAGDEAAITINEGASGLQRMFVDLRVASRAGLIAGSVVLTPTTGAHTYKATLLRNNGTGTVALRASSLRPAFIFVEDIGS